jgi:hypothetical protein
VSTSGEVYQEPAHAKIGWVTGNGDIYRQGVRVGWVTRRGDIIDRESNKVGQVNGFGHVLKGAMNLGHVDCATDRYAIAGAALLLLLNQKE